MRMEFGLVFLETMIIMSIVWMTIIISDNNKSGNGIFIMNSVLMMMMIQKLKEGFLPRSVLFSANRTSHDENDDVDMK